MKYYVSLFCFVLGLTLVLSCRGKGVIEDPSIPAMQAGEATAVVGSLITPSEMDGDGDMNLGSCHQKLQKGYASCQLKRNVGMPELFFATMLPAEWSVSDCDLGIYKSGSTDKAEVVRVDLSEIDPVVQERGFCLLRLEVIERYPDPGDESQLRQVAFAGGWFLEILEDEYFSEPADPVVSWCYKVSGTNKGRRKIEECD